MKRYILAHDLGTSGNKATLFDEDGNLVKSIVYSYDLHMGENNSAEQNALDWWKAVCETSNQLAANVGRDNIAVVSFSGQMMGCLCVDKDGNPLHNALIWADMRSAEQAEYVRERIGEEKFYKITGHRISASYSLTKFMWIRDNLPEVYENTYKMLNAKDYIIYKLTGNFVTEPSDGSSTCLMDLTSQKWSEELIAAGGLDREKLPEIIRSVDVAGEITEIAARETGLAKGTPVVCGGGDGSCAAVGSGVVKEGIANCCLGTSSWISLASKLPVYDSKMATFNFAHVVPGYVLPCGTMQTGGGALSWIVKNMYGGIDETAKQNKSIVYEVMQKEVEASQPGANKLLFLPYLIGERSPRWNNKAKGVFNGLSLNHTRGDMVRAVMEGVGYNLDIILNSFKCGGAEIEKLILIGGGAKNRIWQKILSDIFGLPIMVPDYIEEATSMGAAITGGVGAGIFEDFNVIDKFITVKEKNLPDQKNKKVYSEMKELFNETYNALEPIFKRM